MLEERASTIMLEFILSLANEGDWQLIHVREDTPKYDARLTPLVYVCKGWG